ncbi:hypothetical protein CPAST_c12930 [Clostridium pasteurianum DSM 525 = ATCC 6013]|uniref:Uncharacterized protein n=1 Tax=Clostridium pasteurianum DSM 525 = ATCC 6013 TaxID=1262449 RepID=A0A0H3J3J4_CLOPA|nr:hypothetical protein CPAST_c12930 [Clostridium pasteurianum DSM 525 = ATCC 6013]AOZ78516.1 hypothetical protein AQ984_06225 [Clostridium pasteurianum]AJA51380.1 hypothetical protein CLPA_c12930 [Clostridium pasteurianum DSM 525 = ATCC 6013]AOZ74720.1 hypothetical protein AQ983_06235 [Clostridium pasteurianum DSM 525 = ATCC 6013]ELP58728.1 hypothetical protein F502_13133 [Clostridium pasteurianum DSM 525 = ATCC 6013]
MELKRTKMLIKIIINDLKESSIFSNTILNVIIKIFLCLGVFCGVYNLSKVLKSNMQFNKFITLIICVNVILIYLINLIIHKIIIQEIKRIP